jgi:hypothetical protein
MPSGSRRPHFSSNDDEFFLPQLSRGSHASIDGSSETPPGKINSRLKGSGISGVLFIMTPVYITFSAKIKALTRCESVAARNS